MVGDGDRENVCERESDCRKIDGVNMLWWWWWLLVLVLVPDCRAGQASSLMSRLHTEGERRPTDLNTRLIAFRAASAFRFLVYCIDGLIS